MNEELHIKFEKPYEGIEKINEKEYVLHNYRGDIYLPISSMIIAKREGKNMDIKEIVIESTSGRIQYIQAAKSITGIYFLLKNSVIYNHDNIRIKTELEMGDNPEFMIVKEIDGGDSGDDI